MNPKQFHWGWVCCTALFAFLLGMLFHNLYEWFGQNVFVGLFFPMNESVWEHLKLTFYPILIVWFLFARRLRLDFLWTNRLYACFISVLTGFLLLSGLHYLFFAGFGFEQLWLHLLIYYVSLFCGQWLAVHVSFQRRIPKWTGILSSLILSFMVLLFACFSLHPLMFPIFQPS